MSTLWKQLGVVTAGMFLVVAFQAHAAEGNAVTGAELYKEHCMSCHKEKPAKLIGKPVAELVKSVVKYQEMTNASGGAAKMQAAIKDVTLPQITDVAAYLNSLK